jgi:outer membrane protein insertion porin family
MCGVNVIYQVKLFRITSQSLLLAAILFAANSFAAAAPQTGKYEGRPVASVEVVLEGSPPEAATQAEFLALVKIVRNTEYSTVLARESLQALFDSGRVASARIEVFDVGSATGAGNAGPIRVRFVVQRQVVLGEIKLDLGVTAGTPISPDELRARLNLLDPGRRFSKQTLIRNADEIQTYLRDRGYFNATVDFTEQRDESGTRTTVTYHITPGEQARVSGFNIKVKGFDPSSVLPSLTLQPGAPFTRDALGADLNLVRQAIINLGYLAPLLNDPQVRRDPQSGNITIDLEGTIGPRVTVAIRNYQLSEKTQRELLPVRREGNIDYSAIVEGERRIRNKLQEEGYFFAEVTAVCTVTPPSPNTVANGTAETCENLNPEDLNGHMVNISYGVDLSRRFKLTDIRITGTNKLDIRELESELKTQKANALGFIPFFGYGRGFTSLTLLEQDKRIIRAHMRDLGYRHANVNVLQGTSINGEGLIITFNVDEGPLTRVAGIQFQGNKAYSDARLRDEVKTVVGAPYSRSLVQEDADRILNLYAREGFIDATLAPSIVDLPKKDGDEQVQIVYAITNEGDKFFVNNIIVNGVTGSAHTQRTKRDAIVRAISLTEGDVLRADLVSESERDLYATDAFQQVIISTQPAGDTASGAKKKDVIIDVEEKKPRVLEYGGGYSTDTGPLGLLELSNVNLMNKLRTGAVRLRASPRQQLLRLEYFDPRFARYGKRQFAPLALSLQYQQDSTITRFFRSTIDRGTSGIVQRLDEDGNPIDIFGEKTGQPTINRLTFSAETQRVLDQKTHTVVFVRYSYEDVRLFNIQSLLIQPVLQPDRAIRISRLATSFVRDTRERCELGLRGGRPEEESSLGKPTEVCRYNQLDPTRGEYLSVDYSLALRQLGGSISFNRFQSTYHRYYKVDRVRGTVLAANLTLGLANLFNPRDRDGDGVISEADLALPISERFFSGGSTTLRGFSYEEAGPRQAIMPEGTFHDRQGKPVFLNPFTVPLGGNAMVVLNLEARVPLTRDFQAVPFYDGGNVFRRVGDIFGHSKPDPTSDPLAAVNLRAHWTHTVGLGFRVKTPLGSSLAVDYGFLLNPPEFLIPQLGPNNTLGPPAIIRLQRGHIHFRFTQTF